MCERANRGGVLSLGLFRDVGLASVVEMSIA